MDYNVGQTVRPCWNQNHLRALLEVYRRSEDQESHEQLREDLIEHWWKLHGR